MKRILMFSLRTVRTLVNPCDWFSEHLYKSNLYTVDPSKKVTLTHYD